MCVCILYIDFYRDVKPINAIKKKKTNRVVPWTRNSRAERATGHTSTLDLYAQPCNLSLETVFIYFPRPTIHPTIGRFAFIRGTRVVGTREWGFFLSKFTGSDGGFACVNRPSYDRYFSSYTVSVYTVDSRQTVSFSHTSDHRLFSVCTWPVQ